MSGNLVSSWLRGKRIYTQKINPSGMEQKLTLEDIRGVNLSIFLLSFNTSIFHRLFRSLPLLSPFSPQPHLTPQPLPSPPPPPLLFFHPVLLHFPS